MQRLKAIYTSSTRNISSLYLAAQFDLENLKTTEYVNVYVILMHIQP